VLTGAIFIVMFFSIFSIIPSADAAISEDCVPMNPNNLKLINKWTQADTIGYDPVISHWTIVEGTLLHFDFGTNGAEAFLSLKIIKYYGFNE